MTEARKELETYIKKAEELLEKKKSFTTYGDQLALIDMIKQAKMAIAGLNEVPFVRNRAFLQPREEEAILFATNRYTMVPTYIGNGHNCYGLKEAIKWFETRDVRVAEDLNRESSLQKCYFFLQNAKAGEEIGNYKEDKIETLKMSVHILEETTDTCHAECIACLDALRDAKISKIYRSDLDYNYNIFLDTSEKSKLKELIKADDEIRKEYEKIESIANQTTVEQVKRAYEYTFEEDFDKWNRDYQLLWLNKSKKNVLWNTTAKTVNFKPILGTSYVRLNFTLPSIDNEQDGLGHVWLDNLEMISGDGNKSLIENGGFEAGLMNWSIKASQGNGIIEIDDKMPFCGAELRSVYLCNPTNEDVCVLTYDKKIPIDDSQMFTFIFDAKVDGKLKKGILVTLDFYDENDKEVGQFLFNFNRKTYIDCMNYNLAMQCDAIVYAMTDKKEYAIKAKYEMLHFLNNFCQGAEYWLINNQRPEGCDAYGAVQGGRNLCSIAYTYAQIKDSGTFSEKERRVFYSYIDYMLRYMLDYRDRSELTFEEAQRNCGNWQTDMCIGTALIMMVMHDFPDRKVWINNAYTVLRGQLEYNLNEDGSWPESIRYHHAALERFAGFAKILYEETGENWFIETRLQSMFEYSLNVQTPPYLYFDGKIATPPFGDHSLGDGGEFALFGIYLKTIERYNKKLADEMFLTWKKAGFPKQRLWGESLVIENLLCSSNQYQPNEKTEILLKSTASYANAGVYIFRNKMGTGKEDYFAIMSSSKPVAHGHLDQGSFIIYKNAIPIVMDSGIEGYFDASTPWHICSYSHAVVQFASNKPFDVGQSENVINLSAGTYSLERGWVDVPRNSKVLYCEIGSTIEKIGIEIENPQGAGKHIREVICNHDTGIYKITDRIEGYEGKILMNIPVISKTSQIDGNVVYSKGYYNIDLKTTIETPYEKMWIDKGRSTPLYPINDEIWMLEYIRVIADARHGFATILEPINKSQR